MVTGMVEEWLKQKHDLCFMASNELMVPGLDYYLVAVEDLLVGLLSVDVLEGCSPRAPLPTEAGGTFHWAQSGFWEIRGSE